MIKKIQNNEYQLLKIELNDFVHQSVKMLEILKITERMLFKELLELLELTLKGKTDFVELENVNQKRRKRFVVKESRGVNNGNIVNKETVNTLLELSEKSLGISNDSAMNQEAQVEYDFTQKVHNYMALLCKEMHVSSEYFSKYSFIPSSVLHLFNITSITSLS